MMKLRRLLISLFIVGILLPCALAKEAEKDDDDVVEVVTDDEKDGKSDESHVLQLGKQNLTEILKANEHVLVEFYAPWCGHCKQLEPEYKKAAKTLKDSGSKIILAKVDATVESELANSYGIQSYPTIKFFKSETPSDYTGGRTADTIVQWLNKRTGPPLEWVDDVKDKISKDKVKVAVVCYVTSNSTDFAKICENAGESLREQAKFFATKADKEEVVIMREDEDHETFTGKTLDDLRAWVELEAFPLVGQIGIENYRNYMERGHELVWLLGEREHFDKYAKALRPVAKKTRELYSFVWLDTAEFLTHAENSLGVKEFPALVYQPNNTVGRYVLPDPVEALKDSKVVLKFFDDIKNGKIERIIKSEEVPEKNDNPVKIVVGKTFEKMVLQKDKDVLLEVYAPWCGHCKKLEPIYEEFARLLETEGVSHVVVAKMDGTVNEASVSGFNWQGFPTIFFVKAGSKEPISYDGVRTVDGFMTFLKTHSSKPIKPEEAKPEKEEL